MPKAQDRAAGPPAHWQLQAAQPHLCNTETPSKRSSLGNMISFRAFPSTLPLCLSQAVPAVLSAAWGQSSPNYGSAHKRTTSFLQAST